MSFVAIALRIAHIHGILQLVAMLEHKHAVGFRQSGHAIGQIVGDKLSQPGVFHKVHQPIDTAVAHQEYGIALRELSQTLFNIGLEHSAHAWKQHIFYIIHSLQKSLAWIGCPEALAYHV